MIIHKAIQIKNTYDGYITTTLCGRLNKLETDGFNSEENDKLVTCKICLKIMNNEKHWRFRKYLNENR